MKAAFTFETKAFHIFPSVIIIHAAYDVKPRITAIFKVICQILPFLMWYPNPPLSVFFPTLTLYSNSSLSRYVIPVIMSSIPWICDKRRVSILEGKIRICQMSVYKGDLLSVAHLVVWLRCEGEKDFTTTSRVIGAVYDHQFEIVFSKQKWIHPYH